MTTASRRYAVGPELISPSEAHVRVWAPDHRALTLVLDGQAHAMEPENGGYFARTVPARAGARYGFRFEGDDTIYPDPASRAQPDGPDGLSAIVDLAAYRWHDAAWRGVSLPGQVLYELHVGTFTREGTWRAAAARARAAARRRRHRDADDAGRRVRRRASAGATTACSGSRRCTPTARRTICSTSSTRRTSSGSA